MLKPFLVKLFIFCLPFLSIFLLMVFMAVYVRELMPPYWVLQAAKEQSIVYRPIWQPLDFALYKLEGSLLYRPDVLILGSSRAVQVHSGIFRQQTNQIYNAGFDAASIHDMRQIWAILEAEDALPDLLILQMNYPDFSADVPRIAELNIYRPNVLTNLGQVWNGTLWMGRRWRIAASVLYEDMRGNQGDSAAYWGLIAADSALGYLPDGSEYNAQLSPELAERHYESQYQEFVERRGNFLSGDRVHEEHFADLSEILRIAAENDVAVLAYFPPYRSTIYQAILDSGDYGYMVQAHERIQQLFTEYGYAFFDFSDIALVDGQDAELYDAWHPGQRLNMRLFLAMAKTEVSLLSAYIDSEALAIELEEANDPFFVYTSHNDN